MRRDGPAAFCPCSSVTVATARTRANRHGVRALRICGFYFALYNLSGMKRRDFLYQTGMTAASLALGSRTPRAQSEPSRWRTFEITTQVQVLQPRGATRVWLP